MSYRDYSYDWLRAFSAIMIVLCHICQGFGISSALGYYLGGTYVSVFLILSAYLLGIRHRERIANNPWKFFKARLNRIIPTYYAYLTLAFMAISVCGLGQLTMKQVIGHYTFLNWFIPSTRIAQSPLPQLGHLWFMSCIIMSYLILSIAAIWGGYRKTIKFWMFLTIGIVMVSTGLCAVSRYFIYPSVVILLFPLVFFKGDELFDCIRRVPKAVLIGLLLTFNIGSIIGYHYGLYGYPPLIFWSIAINAMLWIASAPIVFCRESIPNAIGFISMVSFELYLIHHPLCLGYYSLAKFMPLGWAIVTVYAVSIILAYLLHLLVRYASGYFKEITPPSTIAILNVNEMRSGYGYYGLALYRL